MRRLGRLAEGVLEAGWLATVILVPLFINKNSGQVFDPAKAGILRSIAVLMLVAWGIKTLLSPHASADKAALPASSWASFARVPLVVPAALVLSTTLLATLLSIAPYESFWGHRERAQGAFTLLAELAIFAATLANLRSREQLERLLSALILPSLPIAAYAVFQRLNLEPLHITVRETEIQRAASLLGQPVFLGAYLGMVMPFTGLRLIEALRDRAVSTTRRVLRTGLYAGLLLLQGVAALFSESRGPLLGVAVAGAIALLSVAARRGWRRPVLLMCALTGLATTLVVLKVPARLSTAPQGTEASRIAQRAAATFEVSGSGGMFRTVTWGVAERVLRNRAPLEFADGSRDPHPGLRTLVGYGPEVQYAISPPFYDAELPRVFGYFLADRYHNDLWDDLLTTGVLGLTAWLVLQSALLWGLFRWLSLLSSARRMRLFWAAYCGGAALGALGWTAFHGLPFAFLGLQTGGLLGLCLFLAGLALFDRTAESKAPSEVPHEGVLVAALAALVAHFVEVSFSFTVIATGALFWVLCALVVVCGHFQRASGRELEAAPAGSASSRESRAPAAPSLRGPIADGALLALVLLPLGYAFLGGSTTPTRAGAVLWDGLTTVSQPEGAHFPAVAVIALGTLICGALLLSLGQGTARTSSAGTSPAHQVFGVALLTAAAYWLWLSSALAQRGVPLQSIALVVPRNIELRDGATVDCYAGCFLVMLMFALANAAATDPRPANPQPLTWWRIAAAPSCVLLGLWLIVLGSLRPAAAEAAAALGDALKSQNKIALAEEAYLRAAAFSPREDAYQALLAKAYARHARVTASEGEAWLARADQAILQAIERNPIAGENATNRAVIHGNWAQRASGGQRAELLAAVPDLYARALRLNPQDPSLWRLWAGMQLGPLQNAAGAIGSARHALLLEPNGAAAHALLGDCQVAIARSQTGELRRSTLLEAASGFARARELSPSQVAFAVSEGKAYLEAGQPGKAAAAFRAALSLMPVSAGARPSVQALLRQAESASSLVAAPNAGSAPP